MVSLTTLITPTLELVQSYKLPSGVEFVRFSVDGKDLATLDDSSGKFELRQVSTGKILLSVAMGGRVRYAA